jgi:hypothetical protein
MNVLAIYHSSRGCLGSEIREQKTGIARVAIDIQWKSTTIAAGRDAADAQPVSILADFTGFSLRQIRLIRDHNVKIFRTTDKKNGIGSHFAWIFLSRGGSVYVSAVNRNPQPLDVAPAALAKPTVQNRSENDEVVSHLDRKAGQIVIQMVDRETKAVQSQALPEDVLQLGEVVSQPEGRAVR